MVYCNKKQVKYLAKRPSFLTGIAYIQCSTAVVFCICAIIALPLCDNVVNVHMWLLALRYTLYALPPVLLLVAIYIFNASGYVTFETKNLLYYRWCFSNKCKEINTDDITECIVANGLRKRRGEYSHEIGIYLYNRGNVICRFEKNPKLILKIYMLIGDKRFRLIGDNLHLKKIDNFFNLDFSELTEVQKLALLKHYCKDTKGNEIDGEKYLKKKGLL